MNILLSNILLTFVWLVLTGNFTLTNFSFGFLFSYLILFLIFRKDKSTTYFNKVSGFLRFFLFFLKEVVTSNLKVAYEILTPKHKMRPGILAIPLKATTDLEITLLSNMITLTPGTLGLDVSSDRKVLYVHFMYIYEEEEARQQIKLYERKLLEVLR